LLGKKQANNFAIHKKYRIFVREKTNFKNNSLNKKLF